jgi:hypothetical protein
MSDNEIDKIEPVDFDFNESPLLSNQLGQVESKKPSFMIWVGLGCLFIAALLVIFVLPNLVTEYELPLERRVAVADLQSAAEQNERNIAISPFEEAQRSLQRRNAQDVLAELLQKQEELEGVRIVVWGDSDYKAALEHASRGDEYYRNQDFGLARESYSEGLAGLNELIDTIPSAIARIMIDADKAFLEVNSVLAAEKYALALFLDPVNAEAKIGLQRTETLDEVTQLFSSADDLFKDGEFEKAQVQYQQIVDLDSYNEQAQEKRNLVATQVLENEFARIMSTGYKFLEANDPGQAIAAFQQASTLGINADQAVAAITQTQNNLDNVEIDALQKSIIIAEADELWQDAVTKYENVLFIDENLIFALNGYDNASKRAQLDLLLIDAIGNPERFSADDVFQQTLDVYYTGRAIEQPGSRLQNQLDTLEVLLENSQVEIEIQFVSDSLTDVTLLRIGTMGTFEQRSISLKPGRYVAIGKRIGYREVREEFMVGFEQTPDSVVVQCEERIVATRRR